MKNLKRKNKTGKKGKLSVRGLISNNVGGISNNQNKTIRNKNIGEIKKSTIVIIFLEILTMIKLYHWKTKSYSEHKITDNLHEKLSEKFDTFVEVLLGKDESRVRLIDKQIKAFDYTDKSGFRNKMHEYRAFFIDMERFFIKGKDSDLLNIRDEIIADINQFLYLLSFDK